MKVINEKGKKGVQCQQKKEGGVRKLIKAYLLNEETLEELKYGAELTKDQLFQIKRMLTSHRQCFALTLNDVGSFVRPAYRPGFKRFSQSGLQFIEGEIQKQLAVDIIQEVDGLWCAPATLAMKKNGKYLK